MAGVALSEPMQAMTLANIILGAVGCVESNIGQTSKTIGLCRCPRLGGACLTERC
jgi:hypothetical protein